MPEPVKSRRVYQSPVRDERARASRRRILEAATRLFLERGYARTPVREIAVEAAVSEDLIFHLFRTKRGLLKEVMDVGIGGDDEDVALLERPDPQDMRAETDQRVQLAMFATGISAQLARVRPLDDMLRSAAAVDPELAALRHDLQLRQRRQAMTTVVEWIAARGPLVRDTEDAAALVWSLSSPEMHQALIEGWGWTEQRYAEWLRATLEAALLPLENE